MKVTWSERSLQQLEQAREYIARNNIQAALEFVDVAEALIELLAEYPGMGLETDAPNIIVFPLVRYKYLIFYKIISAAEIRIIRLRHGSRKR